MWPFRRKDTLDISKHEPWIWWGSTAGVTVTHETALGVTTVLACIRVISEDIAKHPLNLYERTTEGKQLAVDNPLYSLLKSQPNSWQTSFEWREVMTLHAALTGNGYSLIIRDNRQNVVSLRPLMPHWVEVKANMRGEPEYTIKDGEGKSLGKFAAGDIFHLRGPSWDTVQGLDAVKQARNAIGLAIATEKYQTKLHENSGRPSGILTTPNKLSPEAAEHIKKAFIEEHAGVEKAFSTIILDNAIAWQQIGQTGVDSQHSETRDKQVEEICRGFKVFPQMVGHSVQTTTYASAEAFFSAHDIHTMEPWIVRWEQALDRDLLDRAGPLFIEFDTRRILKASSKDRAEYGRTMVEMGIMTRNEWREIEGLDRLDGLDDPLTPLNMTTGEDDEGTDQTV